MTIILEQAFLDPSRRAIQPRRADTYGKHPSTRALHILSQQGSCIARRSLLGRYVPLSQPVSDSKIAGTGPPADRIAPGARISWFPLVSASHWDLGGIDVAVNGTRLGLCSRDDGKPCHVLVDTGSLVRSGERAYMDQRMVGTSDVSFPRDVFDVIVKALNVKSDCSNYDDLPVMTYILTGEDEDGNATEVLAYWMATR